MSASLSKPSGSSELSELSEPKGDGRGVKLLLGIVFGFLGLSVLVHATALTYVFTAQTDLVRDDYYEAGQRYDEEMALRAAAAGKAFDVRVTAGVRPGVSVRLPGADASLAAATGRIKLYRPGDASLDRTLALRPAGSGEAVGPGAMNPGQGHGAIWHAPGAALTPGHWRVRVELDSQPPLAFEVERDVK